MISVTYHSWWHATEKPAVVVTLGSAVVAALDPVRESNAGHGDDSSYFASEERAIAEETAAPYFTRLFAPSTDLEV